MRAPIVNLQPYLLRHGLMHSGLLRTMPKNRMQQPLFQEHYCLWLIKASDRFITNVSWRRHVNILEMNGDSYPLAQSRARKAG